MTLEEAKVRVARGAALLDRERPGWPERIDLDTLQLSSACFCIRGQLVGCSVIWDVIPGLEGGKSHTEHGFIADSQSQYELLQEAWLSAIADRIVPPAVWTEREPVAVEKASA